jgi:thiol-disulfide isomerase/thioredoxin
MQKKGFVKFVIFFLFVSLSQIEAQKNNFIIRGKIIGEQNGYILLSYFNIDGTKTKDSCLLMNGNFQFKGNIFEPTLVSLKGNIKSIADDDPNATHFFLEPGFTTVLLKYNHFKEAKISNSKTQTEYEELQKKINAISINNDSFFIYLSKTEFSFINEHPGSYVSAFELSLFSSRWSLDTVKFLYNQLDSSIQKSFYGNEVAETINKIENNLPGKKAKEFTATDFEGSSISLSDFKGKYILLDFWASWCIPCRQSTPHIIKLFKKYHNMGFDVIGIAEDDDKPYAWKEAIEKDGVNIWYNILSGMKLEKNGEIDKSQWINDKYGIQVLPTKVLIDKKGIIIGRYEGDDNKLLDKKLSEIFD